jgi:hypothetical protein
MKFRTSTILLLIAASSAFAQLDSFTLHSKYGAPLDRETFTVRPGIEMVVDYGPSKQVCRLQLPSGMQIVGTVPPGAITKKQVDEVLTEVVPPSMRGKEVNRMSMGTIVGTVPPGAITKKQVEEVLAEVVPPSIRGKEVNRMSMGTGLHWMSATEYEHVTIAESKNGDIGTGITVTFKDASCPLPKAP